MFMRVPPKNRFIEIAELSAFIFHQTDKLEVTYLTVSKTLIPRRMQARWDLGIQDGGPTKDEVISAYIQDLRQNGLDGSVDWSALTRELDAFKATSPEELEDGLDYLASRYVAARPVCATASWTCFNAPRYASSFSARMEEKLSRTAWASLSDRPRLSCKAWV